MKFRQTDAQLGAMLRLHLQAHFEKELPTCEIDVHDIVWSGEVAGVCGPHAKLVKVRYRVNGP